MEEKDENVVEEATQNNQSQVEDKKPEIDESKFESAGDDSVFKVDLSKSSTIEKEDVVSESETEKIEVEEKTESNEEVKEKEEEPVIEEITVQQDETVEDEQPVIEETTEEVQQLVEETEKAIEEAEATGKEIPENIQKLMRFMEETGGSLEDYVKLNKDYSGLDDNSILREYYQQSKPHLNSEEIDFLIKDYFSYDEEVDEEIDIKRKKLALKEQVAQAKQHLDSAKSKYYEEIQYGSKLTGEQQKAIDFFNRYNKESKEQQKVAEHQHNAFVSKTDKLFNKDFKGFEYNIGDKKFRFNVKNAGDVKETQSDINNFVKKFLNKNNEMSDAKGYHKSLYTAMNPDAIANHFYEQGKADALKNSMAKSKNIDMNPRQQHKEVNAGGLKFRVLGDDSSDFKFKIKNRK